MKNGDWKAQVRKDGKRRERTFSTKKEAAAWERRMRKSDEEWQEKTAITSLADWAQDYLDNCQALFVEKTYKEKRTVFKRFFQDVDPHMPVEDLTPGIVQTFFVKQKKERSGYASNKDRKNLLAGWNWGMMYMNPQLPKENPFETPKMPEERSPRYVPPEEDFWKVFELTEGQDRLMLLMFLHLACRRGEAFRLKWDDVNFKDKLVRLWTRKRENGSFEYERLPMTSELQGALLDWHDNCPVKSEYVFVCLDQMNLCHEYYGGPFTVRQHFMRKLCERAGVKPFGFHAIRHLTATILYHKGYDLSVIQTILRHKSPTTTNRYLKGIGLENVRGALENLFKRNKEVVADGVGQHENIMFGGK
jgi:integrase